MVSKAINKKVKANKKVIDSSARCITCTKPCSMSGLCMKHWPEFDVRAGKGVKDDDKDYKKNS